MGFRLSKLWATGPLGRNRLSEGDPILDRIRSGHWIVVERISADLVQVRSAEPVTFPCEGPAYPQYTCYPHVWVPPDRPQEQDAYRRLDDRR